MKKNVVKKISVLAAALLLAVSVTSCGNKQEAPVKDDAPVETEAVASAESEAAAPAEMTANAGVTVLGEESAKFVFGLTVVDAEENKTLYTVHTDEDNVGDALFSLEFINDASFFDTVNGVTASWDEDNAYWAVYVGEEYASVGVGEMTFTEGEQMELSFVYTVSE